MNIVDLKKYVVVYRNDDVIGCAVMSGQEVANTYGFSDCSGTEITSVFMVLGDGGLTRCHLRPAYIPPLNRVTISPMWGEDETYYWEEH